MSGLAGDQLDDGDGLFLGLVRQHRAGGDVADGPDASRRRPPMIDRHEAALVGDDADAVEAEAGRIGPPSDGQQDIVGRQGVRGAALGRLEGQLDLLGRDHSPGDLGAQLELEPLLGQGLLQGRRDLRVHPRGYAVEIFHHRHLGAEAAPDRAELQPDDAGADDHQMLGHLRQ